MTDRQTQTDRQTDRQTDMIIRVLRSPIGGEVPGSRYVTATTNPMPNHTKFTYRNPNPNLSVHAMLRLQPKINMQQMTYDVDGRDFLCFLIERR